MIDVKLLTSRQKLNYWSLHLLRRMSKVSSSIMVVVVTDVIIPVTKDE